MDAHPWTAEGPDREVQSDPRMDGNPAGEDTSGSWNKDKRHPLHRQYWTTIINGKEVQVGP